MDNIMTIRVRISAGRGRSGGRNAKCLRDATLRWVPITMEACTPYSARDDKVAGCYAWCAVADVVANFSRLTDHCQRCKCRGCEACQRLVHGQTNANGMELRAETHPCSANLLVLIRGEAFREGDRTSHLLTTNVYPELLALHSIARNVLAPARANGWIPTVMADIIVAEHHRQRLDQVLRGSLNAAAVRFSSKLSTQVASLLASLRWARSAVPHDAILIVRVDIEVKQLLPLPHADFATFELIAPFRCPPGERVMGHNSRDRWTQSETVAPVDLDESQDNPGRRDKVTKSLPSAHAAPTANRSIDALIVADAILFVPRCRMDELLDAMARNENEMALHKLCRWMSGGGIRFWEPSGLYDSNSHVEANPVYRIVGRPEGSSRLHEWQQPLVLQACSFRGAAESKELFRACTTSCSLRTASANF